MAIVPLNNNAHADLKIKPGADLSIVEKQHMLPLVVHEFASAATEFPIVFVKNSDTGQFQPIVMLGLETGENLFYKGGKWEASYLPGIVTNFPFKLLPSQNDESQLMIGIDDSCAKLSNEEGEAFFDENGKETEVFNARKEGLTQYFEHGQITQMFIDLLVKEDLITERNINLHFGDKKMDINGIYLIDEEKLNALDDEKFLDFRKRGFLSVIYSHLNSMHQINRLGAKKAGAL